MNDYFDYSHSAVMDGYIKCTNDEMKLIYGSVYRQVIKLTHIKSSIYNDLIQKTDALVDILDRDIGF